MKGLNVEVAVLVGIFILLLIAVFMAAFLSLSDEVQKAIIGWAALTIGALIGLINGSRDRREPPSGSGST